MRLLAAASEAKPRAAPTKIRRAKTSRLNEYVYTGYAAANLIFAGDKICVQNRKNFTFEFAVLLKFQTRKRFNAVWKISGKARRVARRSPEIFKFI